MYFKTYLLMGLLRNKHGYQEKIGQINPILLMEQITPIQTTKKTDYATNNNIFYYISYSVKWHMQ